MNDPKPLDYQPPERKAQLRVRDYVVATCGAMLVFALTELLVTIGSGQLFNGLDDEPGIIPYLPAIGILLVSLAAAAMSFRATLKRYRTLR